MKKQLFQFFSVQKSLLTDMQELNARVQSQRFFRPVLAVMPPLAACFLQWLLWPLINPYVWFLFYPAVFISSWIGGWRSSIFATLLSTVLVWLLFVSPQYTFIKDNPKLYFPAGVFFLMGIVFSVFNEHLRQAKQGATLALEQTRAANNDLQQANQKITRLWEKTLQLDTLKTQFFSNVSHELRTPLTLVLGPVERMLNSPLLPEVFRRDLEVIERISMAEENGMIASVDEWVLRHACAQAKQWISSGLQPKRIGINLSGKHIFSRNFPGLVSSVINENQLQPGDVEFEIEVTESAFQSMEESVDVLAQLRLLGVKIAIDGSNVETSGIGGIPSG